ncbi:MAG: N-acetyltransferase [Ketobacter sp.]
MIIRNYTPSDFEAVARVYNESKPDEFYGEDNVFSYVPLAQDKPMMKLFHDSNILVCEVDNLVGFGGHFNKSISWLFVSSEHRNKGIASNFLEHLINDTKGHLSLTVAKSNKRARRLYQRHGFTIEKEFNGIFQGKNILVCRYGLAR